MPDVRFPAGSPAGLNTPNSFAPLPAGSVQPRTPELQSSISLTARGPSADAGMNRAPRSARLPQAHQTAGDEGHAGEGGGAVDARASNKDMEMAQQYLMRLGQEMLSKQETAIKDLFAKKEDDEDEEPDE